MDLSGQTLGQYQIIEPIGSGGMATVYKAYQVSLDRYVAIKVLPAHHALTPGFKERFILEIRTVAQLSHPNILPIYDAHVDGDLSYYAMKYVPGLTLKDILGPPMELARASHLLDQIAQALDHAHEQGIIHRDIKPSNILLENEWVLLADFGLAKLMAGDQHLTSEGIIVGTPSYLSPEQAEGQPADQRADIYSLGVVLYEMLLGQIPYQADTAMAILFKHLYEPIPRPRRLRPDIPPGIEGVILKALDKDPAMRFNRAGELADAFRVQLQTSSIRRPQAGPGPSARLFICYKRSISPDHQLAHYLHTSLTEAGHDVFIDTSMRTGDEWLKEIDQRIKDSDFLIVLLSKESADSEMVQAEVRRAYEYRKLQKRPQTLPVRVGYEGLLPYSVDAFLDPLQYVVWQTEADNERVKDEILAAIDGRLPAQTPVAVTSTLVLLCEDGNVISNEEKIAPPLPEFDPRLLEMLEAPGGVVKLRDTLYIERRADEQLKREIIKKGTTTTIRASRQTGKSSLIVRGVNYARDRGANIINFDLQRVDTDRLLAPDLFLRDFAEAIVRKLRLDVAEVENFWRGSLGPQYKLTYLMEDYVLAEIDNPIVLALDEVDRLLDAPFHNDFFALLRSWHNSRALDEVWDKLNIVMVISTEPYQLISDVNQSPFNVGLRLYLEDFDEHQVRDLNRRHGSPVSEADFGRLMALFGGQPYLTRKALYTLVTENITWAGLTQAATLDNGPFGDHLRRHQWLLRDKPELRAALKQVIDHHDCPDEMALFRLLQAGLVKGSGEAYLCRCDLYRLYFKDKLS